MVWVLLDDQGLHENNTIIFKAISDDSVTHHNPISYLRQPPGLPIDSAQTILNNCTANLIQLPKSAPGKDEKSLPTLDGNSIHTDDGDETAITSRLSCTRIISNLRNWYASQLESHPIRTKSLTAGLLAIVGDLLAQGIEYGTDFDTGDMCVDNRRIFAMFIEGSCVSGPLLHYAFQFYEYIFPIHGIDDVHTAHGDRDLKLTNSYGGEEEDIAVPSDHECPTSKRQYLAALSHVVFDQVIMAFPYVAGMMIVTALVEGHWSTLGKELEEEYINNVKASWMAAVLLAPSQFVVFHYLPIKWRVLAVNLQDVIWIITMSYMTHRTREASEPFFDFDVDDLIQADQDSSSQNRRHLIL